MTLLGILVLNLLASTIYAEGCRENFAFDKSTASCIFKFVATDIDNCGRIGNRCSKYYDNAFETKCVNGACIPTCDHYYAFDGIRCRLTSSDANNCGSIGNSCQAHSHSTVVCDNSICRQGPCIPGYRRESPRGAEVSECVPIKRRPDVVLAKPITTTPGMCPVNKKACPVPLSTQDYYLSSSRSSLVECIDTRSNVENCGGCSSTGEGLNCTKIAFAKQVSCRASSCIVATCERGFKPSLDDRRCKRAGKGGRKPNP